MLNKFLEKRRWRFLKEWLFSPYPILDIGCRDKTFINRFKNGVGIDKEGTVGNKLNFEDKSFTYVTMLAVVEHIKPKDMFELQKEIARALKKYGFLIITTPSRFSHPLLKVLSFLRLIPKKDIDEHVVYYNKKNILEVFTKFEIKLYQRFDIFNQLFILSVK